MSAQLDKQESSTSSSSSSDDEKNFADTTVAAEDAPVTLEVYANQTGGHSQIFTTENNTKIVKPLNPHEKLVYNLLKHSSMMQPFTAKFHGILRHADPTLTNVNREFQNAGEFIILENLTAKYKKPCILDIKLGHRAFVAAGDKGKSQKYQVKYAATTAVTLGFRVSGIRVYRPSFDNYFIRKTVHANRLLSDVDGSLAKALETFLFNGVEVRSDLIPAFVKKLDHLRHTLTHQSEFDFVASSVLLMYEGDPTISETEDPIVAAKVDIRLIDFDHTFTQNHPLHHKYLSEISGAEHKLETEPVPLHNLIKPEASNDKNGVARGIGNLTRIMRRVLMTGPKQKTLAVIKPCLLKKKGNDKEPRRHRSHSDPARLHNSGELPNTTNTTATTNNSSSHTIQVHQ